LWTALEEEAAWVSVLAKAWEKAWEKASATG